MMERKIKMDSSKKEQRSFNPCNESYTPGKRVQNSFSPYQETSQADSNSTITDSQLDKMISDLQSDD